jgi:sugar phosphate permease
VTISVTRPDVARDLDLSPTQMGYVFSAFYLAYALFEIPTGLVGRSGRHAKGPDADRLLVVGFTVLTGVAFNYPSLVVIGSCSAAAKPGAWPNVARTFSRWFPRQERGTAQGLSSWARTSRAG